jgi:hypothetical protein
MGTNSPGELVLKIFMKFFFLPGELLPKYWWIQVLLENSYPIFWVQLLLAMSCSEVKRTIVTTAEMNLQLSKTFELLDIKTCYSPFCSTARVKRISIIPAKVISKFLWSQNRQQHLILFFITETNIPVTNWLL